MSRYTVKDMRAAIKNQNFFNAYDGTITLYKEQGRNGYQAIDEYEVKPDGRLSCMRLAGSGSSREAIAEMYQAARHRKKAVKPTRAQALTMLQHAGIDFSGDYHHIGHTSNEMLITWAKLTKYRKPKNANGSLSRYFFYHLAKKV